MAKTNFVSSNQTDKQATFVPKWNVENDYVSKGNPPDPSRHHGRNHLSHKQTVIDYYHGNSRNNDDHGNGRQRGHSIADSASTGTRAGKNEWGPFKSKDHFIEMHMF